MIAAIVGPSGAGKDRLLAGLLAICPDVHLVRRVITRPVTAGGEEFDGVSDATFDARLQAGEFALHWPAHGLRYAIPWDQVQGRGKVLFNGSRLALAQARAVFPDLRIVLVTAPLPVLAARLAARGREGQADILARLARARFDLPEGITPDAVVVNDGTPEAGVQALISALYPSPSPASVAR